MSDLISRQSAINAIENTDVELAACEWDELVHALMNVPSAQQWIPVSERLPDLWDERYLVSLAWGGVGVMEYKSTGFHNYGSFSPVPIETVTAWMPLPEPWRGKMEESDETIVHCNVKENAELIAKILDADVDGEVWKGEEG